MAITEKTQPTVASESSWNGFRGALWQREINVRAFIQQNYTPYEGTQRSWRRPPLGRRRSGSS